MIFSHVDPYLEGVHFVREIQKSKPNSDQKIEAWYRFVCHLIRAFV